MIKEMKDWTDKNGVSIFKNDWFLMDDGEIVPWECLPWYPGVDFDNPNFLGIPEP